MYENEIWSCRNKIKDCEDEIGNLKEEIDSLRKASEQISGKLTEVSSIKDTLLQKLHKVGDVDCGLLIQRKIIEELGKVVSGQGFEAFKSSVNSGASDVYTEIEEREKEIERLEGKIDELQKQIQQYEYMASEAERAAAEGVVENG